MSLERLLHTFARTLHSLCRLLVRKIFWLFSKIVKSNQQSDEYCSKRRSEGDIEMNLGFKSSSQEVDKRSQTREQHLLTQIRENLQQNLPIFRGPFGKKQITFCDHFINGRSLTFIEDYLRQDVLPFLTNDPSATSVSGLQSTMFLDDARNVLRSSVNASVEDELLFLAENHDLLEEASKTLVDQMNIFAPVVFASCQLHHESLKPWLEIESEIITIKNDDYGKVDLLQLLSHLENYRSVDRTLVGIFPIGSRFTGCLNEDLEITFALHKFGALAIWDYSSFAASVHIDMNPKVPGDDEGFYCKDVIFFSLTNFLGGLQASNVIFVKKPLIKRCSFQNEIWTSSRILGFVRSALVTQLKLGLGAEFIMKMEKERFMQIKNRLSRHATLVILGSIYLPRVATVSFLIRHIPTGLFLHQNFIVKLLNDLFGIQARKVQSTNVLENSFVAKLLAVDDDTVSKIKSVARDGLKSLEIIVPGLVQVDVPWFANEDEIKFILDALELIADKGWTLLPLYLFTRETSDWQHQLDMSFQERTSISKISYENGFLEPEVKPQDTKPTYVLHDAILKGKEIIAYSKKKCRNTSVPDQIQLLPSEGRSLKWFMTSVEAKNIMTNKKKAIPQGLPDRILSIKGFRIIYEENVDQVLGKNPYGTLSGNPRFPKPDPNFQAKKAKKGSWLYSRSISSSNQTLDNVSVETVPLDEIITQEIPKRLPEEPCQVHDGIEKKDNEQTDQLPKANDEPDRDVFNEQVEDVPKSNGTDHKAPTPSAIEVFKRRVDRLIFFKRSPAPQPAEEGSSKSEEINEKKSSDRVDQPHLQSKGI